MPLTTPAIRYYKAYLEKGAATQPPIATIIQNTLGVTPVYTRTSTGIYRITSTGLFKENKTVCPPFDTSGRIVLPTYASSPLDYMWTLARESNDYLGLYTYNGTGTLIEFEEMMSVGKLYLEINIYA